MKEDEINAKVHGSRIHSIYGEKLMIKKAVFDFDEILSYVHSCFIFRNLTEDELTLVMDILKLDF